jgi:hypothetical protein
MGRRKFTSGIGPDGSSSGSMAARTHGPEKSGITELLSAPITGEPMMAAADRMPPIRHFVIAFAADWDMVLLDL